MKSARIVLALVGTALFALALATPASAATATVPANDFYSIEVGPFFGGGPIMQGSDLTFTWSSSGPLTLVVSGPSGVVESYSSSNHGSDTIHIDETGTYFMTWTNSGSTSTSLTYDYEVDPFAPVEDTLDAVLLAVIAAVVVVVVVIVLVVFLVLRQDKPKTLAPGEMPPVAAIPQGVSGHCPKCGSSVDGMAMFCPRCGARVR